MIKETQQASQWGRVKAAQKELRDVFRIKDGVDYALTVKYAKVHVMCASVYQDSILEVMSRHGIAVETLHTYP